MKNRLVPCAIALAAFGSMALASAFAEDLTWTDTQVCAAGVSAYFYLGSAPATLGSFDGWETFRSATGNNYDCRLDGSKIIFKWIAKSGALMNSSSTSYTRSAAKLTVRTDIGASKFVLTDTSWTKVE